MAYVVRNNKRKITRIDNAFGKYTPEVVARPVDTFVRHQAPANAGGEYMELAQALSSISPQLNALMKRRHQEKIEADEAKGQKLYHEKGERLSWEDYRKSVPTLPGLNTSVRNGFLKARMANEASVFREALNNAYASGDASVELPDGTKIAVAESDDPAVFNLWLNRFTKDYIRDNLGEDADPEYFVKEFLPKVEQYGQNLGTRHIEERNKTLWYRNIAEHGKLISGTLDNMIRDGGISTDDETVSVSAAHLSKLARSMIESGIPIDTVNEAMVSALIVASLNPDLDNGEELFDIAKHIDIGGRSLWDNGRTAYTLTKAAEEVRKERHYLKAERKREEREQKEEERVALENNLADYILSGRTPPKALIEQLRRDHGVEDLSRFTSNIRNIAHGFSDRSSSGGDGGHSKAFAEAVKINYLRRHAAGEKLSMMDVLRDPNVAALKYTDQKAIIGMFSKDTKESRDLLKDLASGNKDIVDAELGGVSSEKGEVSYLKDVAHKQASMAVNLILKDYPSMPLEAPEKFKEAVRHLYREAARETKVNSEDLLSQGYNGGLMASDPDVIDKSRQLKKQKETQKKLNSSSLLQSVVQSMLEKGELDAFGSF